MATEPRSPESMMFGAAFLCDSVSTTPDGVLTDILGVGPELAIVTQLPIRIERTIFAMVVGPPGKHMVACVLSEPNGERGYLGKLKIQMVQPPKRMIGKDLGLPGAYGRTTAPITIEFRTEGQHFIEVALDEKYLVFRIPILVRLEPLAGGVH